MKRRIGPLLGNRDEGTPGSGNGGNSGAGVSVSLSFFAVFTSGDSSSLWFLSNLDADFDVESLFSPFPHNLPALMFSGSLFPPPMIGAIQCVWCHHFTRHPMKFLVLLLSRSLSPSLILEATPSH